MSNGWLDLGVGLVEGLWKESDVWQKVASLGSVIPGFGNVASVAGNIYGLGQQVGLWGEQQKQPLLTYGPPTAQQQAAQLLPARTQGVPMANGMFTEAGMLPAQWPMTRKPSRVQSVRYNGYYWTPESGWRKRRRRMNVLNPRALYRAHRRMMGFEKFVKRNFSLGTGIKPKRTRFRRKKRRS